MPLLHKHVFIIAGEPSGDLAAAKLVRDVHKTNSTVLFSGVGGKHMRQANVDVLIDSSDLAIVGFIEVLIHLKYLHSVFRRIKKILETTSPDLLILVDYPGFNLRIAKIAKKNNIKVLYYIGPQIWAWHQSRIKIIQQCVDRMAILFPFEADYYKKAHVPTTLVRHPLLDIVQPNMDIATTKKTLGFDPDNNIVGLLPGSRKGEVRRMLPVIIEAAQKLQREFKKIQFALPLASTILENDITPYLKDKQMDVKIIQQKTYDALHICDAIIAVSGTVTLEIALLQIPMVIIYKTGAINAFLTKRLINPNLNYMGLCNIIAQEMVAKELLQEEADANNIATEITRLISNNNYRKNILNRLSKVHQKLFSPNIPNISDVVLEMLSDDTTSRVLQ